MAHGGWSWHGLRWPAAGTLLPFHPYLVGPRTHAHGLLTPNANRSAPEAVTSICDILANAHLAAAGEDFKRRVQRYLKQNPPSDA